MWFEYAGRVEIVNHKSKLKCKIDFKPYSWFSGQVSRCEGTIVDVNDKVVALLNGKWDQCFFASDDVSSASDFAKKVDKCLKNEDLLRTYDSKKVQLLWKNFDKNLSPEHYLFSDFTYKLNELYDDLRKDTQLKITCGESSRVISMGPLPITDSRYRPDMRLYEEGKIDMASSEKNRLEEKQRDTQRKMESGETNQWSSLWFDKKPHAICEKEETWTFNQTYWKRDYAKCPNVY